MIKSFEAPCLHWFANYICHKHIPKSISGDDFKNLLQEPCVGWKPKVSTGASPSIKAISQSLFEQPGNLDSALRVETILLMRCFVVLMYFLIRPTPWIMCYLIGSTPDNLWWIYYFPSVKFSQTWFGSLIDGSLLPCLTWIVTVGHYNWDGQSRGVILFYSLCKQSVWPTI